MDYFEENRFVPFSENLKSPFRHNFLSSLNIPFRTDICESESECCKKFY